MQEVAAISFPELVRDHGAPYYVKIDIEGADAYCIRSLRDVGTLPRYISVESAATTAVATFDAAFDEIAQLWAQGYRRFKYVDQSTLENLGGTILSAEGPSAPYVWTKHSSGPFGEESPGAWLSAEDAIARMRQLIRYQNFQGFGGSHAQTLPARIIRKAGKILTRRTSHSWYDLHARLGDDAQR